MRDGILGIRILKIEEKTDQRCMSIKNSFIIVNTLKIVSIPNYIIMFPKVNVLEYLKMPTYINDAKQCVKYPTLMILLYTFLLMSL